MDLATIFRQSLELWGNPPYTELPPETILAAGNRILSQHNLDLDLTPDACFAVGRSDVFSFASSTSRERELEVDIDDVSRVIRVESRGTDSTSDDDWEEERVASFENWSDIAERSDGNYVAFYGTPPVLTMVVARDVSSLEFRIVYKMLKDKIAASDEVLELPGIYEPLLVYDLALEFGELIDNRSPEFGAVKKQKMPYLMARREDAVKRIEKWRRSQRGTSVTTRRSFSDRSGTIGGRRFTVRF